MAREGWGIRDTNAVSILHKHYKEKKIGAKLPLSIPNTANCTQKVCWKIINEDGTPQGLD